MGPDTASADDAPTGPGPGRWAEPRRSEVEAAVAGDREVLGRLLHRYAGLVRRVVLDEIRARDEASDCVQEAFARALRDIGCLRDPGRFRPWLVAIARNVAIDHRRSWIRHADRVARGEEDRLGRVPAAAPAPDEVAAARSQARALLSAVAALPEREATALILVTHLDLAPAEVAGALGTTSGNAKVIVHRARRKLRDELVLRTHQHHRSGCAVFARCGPSDTRAHVAGCSACQAAAYRALRSGTASTAVGSGS